MKLTDAKVRAAKYSGKPEKLRDGNGLYLHILPSGKYWRYDYRYLNKRKTYSMGVYPKVSLKEARVLLFAAKDQLAQGINPTYHKQLTKHVNSDHRFQVVAMDWLLRHDCTDRTRHDIELRFNKDVFPVIGEKLVQTIEPPDVLNVIRRIESRGTYDLAKRVNTNISQVMRYCVSIGLVKFDPCRDLAGAIRRKRVIKHYAAITNRTDFGQLLRDIDSYSLNTVIALALQLAPHVALRPSELRAAPWTEIDLENMLWTIPRERMKKDKEHTVPITRQSEAILRRIRQISGRGEWLFPSPMRGKSQPISENTLNTAINRLGYKDKHTPHGFRSSFSTITNESRLFSTDAIEIQLAHLDKDRTRAVYHRSVHLDERRKMMQWWSDQIDIMRLDHVAA